MFVLLLLLSIWSGDNSTCICKEKLENLVPKARYIFEAEIVKIDEPPAMWSESAIFSWQEVKYKIHSILKGKDVAEEIIVNHAVIENSPLSDKTKPQLSPTFFYTGRKLILFVDEINSKNNNPSKMKRIKFVEIDSYCSSLPYDKKKIEDIREIIKNNIQP
jgi:hypothetical protein